MKRNIVGYYKQRSSRFRALFIGSLGMMAATAVSSLTRVGIVAILARYYSKEEFGMWAAITAITAVTVTVDFGFSNALRNKLSLLEVKGKCENFQAHVYYLSIFYFLFFLGIILSLALMLIVVSGSIPIQYLFKTSDVLLQQSGIKIILTSQLIIFLGMPFGLSMGALFSYQKAHWCAYLNSGQSILYLLIVIILTTFKASIISIAILYFAVSFIGSTISCIIFLKMRKWRPIPINYRKVLNNLWELTPVGLRFFITQISNAFLTNAATIALGAFIGLADTADYNLVLKLYMFGFAIYQSILNPLWAGYADAVYRNDWLWCKKTFLTTMSLTILCFGVVIVVMFFFGNNLLTFFAGKSYSSTSLMFVLVGLWVLASAIGNCAAQVQNALGKLSMIIAINVSLAAVIMPTMSYLCDKWGAKGIVLGNLLIALPGALFIPIQAFSLIFRGIRNNSQWTKK